ncbi:MAG: hypothetical protein J5823_04535 [Paludibacteraceae bacterium]|nr:hypothetical protein [Paludibacteraceae bacterium]
MKAILPPEIRSISGRLGKMVFRTYTKPDGTPDVRCYSYKPRQRRTPVSDKEVANRTLFGQISAAARALQRAGDTRPYKQIWKEVQSQINNR